MEPTSIPPQAEIDQTALKLILAHGDKAAEEAAAHLLLQVIQDDYDSMLVSQAGLFNAHD